MSCEQNSILASSKEFNRAQPTCVGVVQRAALLCLTNISIWEFAVSVSRLLMSSLDCEEWLENSFTFQMWTMKRTTSIGEEPKVRQFVYKNEVLSYFIPHSYPYLNRVVQVAGIRVLNQSSSEAEDFHDQVLQLQRHRKGEHSVHGAIILSTWLKRSPRAKNEFEICEDDRKSRVQTTKQRRRSLTKIKRTSQQRPKT